MTAELASLTCNAGLEKSGPVQGGPVQCAMQFSSYWSVQEKRYVDRIDLGPLLCLEYGSLGSGFTKLGRFCTL